MLHCCLKKNLSSVHGPSAQTWPAKWGAREKLCKQLRGWERAWACSVQTSPCVFFQPSIMQPLRMASSTGCAAASKSHGQCPLWAVLNVGLLVCVRANTAKSHDGFEPKADFHRIRLTTGIRRKFNSDSRLEADRPQRAPTRFRDLGFAQI